jgi:hypothetical protein
MLAADSYRAEPMFTKRRSGTQAVDLVGQRFGRLVVRERGDLFVSRAGKREYLWLCQCDCGAVSLVRSPNLRSGNTKSCGCLQSEVTRARSRTHGRTNSSAYWRWRAMMQRCTNPNDVGWANYGGRGIMVCEAWRTFEGFYRDMGDPPPDMTIDRIDVDGNYEPSNCRWATMIRQARNKRVARLMTLHGQTKCLHDWTDVYGINYQLVFYRLQRGWDFERALTTPARDKRRAEVR